LLTLAYAVCAVPVAPIRSEANHRAEQVSQALFGERLEILEEVNHTWFRVRCAWDNYEGWVVSGQVMLISPKDFQKPTRTLAVGQHDHLIIQEGNWALSPGSELYQLRKNHINWHFLSFKFKGKKLMVKSAAAHADNLKQWSKLFLGSPYLWGGRNKLGIDCSGYTQVVYKLMGIMLPRDAWQQAEDGEPVSFLQEAKCGDLAFFDNEEGHITHVGILLNDHTIIHATETSGAVVIDAIDSGGIISKRLRTRTHKLRIIKRYF